MSASFIVDRMTSYITQLQSFPTVTLSKNKREREGEEKKMKGKSWEIIANRVRERYVYTFVPTSFSFADHDYVITLGLVGTNEYNFHDIKLS